MYSSLQTLLFACQDLPSAEICNGIPVGIEIKTHGWCWMQSPAEIKQIIGNWECCVEKKEIWIEVHLKFWLVDCGRKHIAWKIL